MYKEKSFILRPADADKNWYLVDVKDMVVGRAATEIARILRGKNNPKFTTTTDSGDFVVVINADKVKFSGNKLNNKIYYRVTGYMGGLKQQTAKEMLGKHPERVMLNAVKGMLPKTSLGRKQLTKLKIFAGETHTHEAQSPKKIDL